MTNWRQLGAAAAGIGGVVVLLTNGNPVGPKPQPAAEERMRTVNSYVQQLRASGSTKLEGNETHPVFTGTVNVKVKGRDVDVPITIKQSTNGKVFIYLLDGNMPGQVNWDRSEIERRLNR